MVASKRQIKDQQFTLELLELGVDEVCLEEIMAIHRKEPNLVPYECKRKYNIKKNEEKLKNLNIIQTKPTKKRPCKPVKHRVPSEQTKKAKRTISMVYDTSETARKSARIAVKKPINYNPDELEEKSDHIPSEPTRKSARISITKPINYNSDLLYGEYEEQSSDENPEETDHDLENTPNDSFE